MSANIEVNERGASYAENGRKERAWHRLGQVFDRPMTMQEALEASHADYEVGLQPIVALTPNLSEYMAKECDSISDFQDGMMNAVMDSVVPNYKVTMRLDTMKPLGIVTDSYGVVQNREAFAFIDTLCSGGLTDHAPVIECAGVLGQGERVFVTAKFAEDIILDNKGDDKVEMYMVFTTSHDGSGSVKCLCTPIRVVCNNTLNSALRNNVGCLSLRHSINVTKRLDLTNEENAAMACKALNLMGVYTKSLKERFELLKAVKVAEKDLDRIFASVVLSDVDFDLYKKTNGMTDISTRAKNLMGDMRMALENGIGQDMGVRGTAMWVYNGLTSYFQNNASFRDEETKFDAITQGRVQQKVYKAVQEMLCEV